MEADHALLHFFNQEQKLSTANRPMRLQLGFASGTTDSVLLPQHVSGTESICGALEYNISCVATDAALPLKQFIAVPAALELVTDRGDLRRFCGIVTEASAGDSDGGLATYRIVVRDALAVMEKRVNTRIFRKMNEYTIVKTILDEWRHSGSVLSHAFEYECADFFDRYTYPDREFTMQHNESDAAFIRRLLKRRGIAWYFRSGRSRDGAQGMDHGIPAHTLVMFNVAESLKANASGVVRFHRDDATEERDTITKWTAIRSLQGGTATLHSWDYKTPRSPQFMAAEAYGAADQGEFGNVLAARLDDYRILMPHAGDDNEDLCRLGKLRVARCDLESKCFAGEGSVRDFCAGEYFALEGHPEIDRHPGSEREFVITEMRIVARNNLPKAVHARINRLFARSRWEHGDSFALASPESDSAGAPIRVAFTAVRRGIPIVPAYDPGTDLPRAQMQSAVVVGPADEEVYCDELGRVRIRFPGTRAQDHEHANGKGAADDEADSAWVRVASNWAGNGPGSMQQCGTLALPRIGTEVLVAFLGGDPDKPLIVGQLYNHSGSPPALSRRDTLPGNRYLSGIRSREIRGSRGNQLCFNDANGQISAQLASDHGASQLNLGWLAQPPVGGKGEARGEGAELRSDRALALRGAEGILITSSGREDTKGHQLDRQEMLRTVEALQEVAQKLSKLAQKHALDQQDGPELEQLVGKLKSMHNDAEPLIAMYSPAGIVAASERDFAANAKGALDVMSGEDTRLTAGRNVLIRAALDISLFANELGIKLIAAAGQVRIQAQNDAIEVLAKKVIEIISTTDWINLKARTGVRINGGGSELVIDANGIKGYTSGKNEMHAADHQTFPAQSKAVQFPGEVARQELCIPCLLRAAKANEPLMDAQ